MLSSLVAWAGLEMKASARRGIRIAILLVLAVVFTLAAVFHALAAFGEWLRLHYSPIDSVDPGSLILGFGSGYGCHSSGGPLCSPASGHIPGGHGPCGGPLAVTLAGNGLPRLGFLLPVVVMAGFLAGRWTDK